MDTLVFSHVTALRALRQARRAYSAIPWRTLTPAEQRRVLRACKPNRQLLDYDLLNRYGLWEPDEDTRIDILTSSTKNRRTLAPVSCHVISRELPPGSILEIEKGLYCTSPAFTALLYSHGRTVPEAASLLMEFLGTYTLPPEATVHIAQGEMWGKHRTGTYSHGTQGTLDELTCNQASYEDVDSPPASTAHAFEMSGAGHYSKDTQEIDQAHYSCEPATTIKQVNATSRWTKSSRDLSFRQAVNLVASHSASPAETIQYCMLGFPMRYGGFACAALPKGMHLNHRINFTHDAVRISSGMPYAIADVYIPAAKTDIEYNGAGHEELAARIHDGNRNNGLRSMGVNVIVIQRDQMRDITALEAIARTVYRFAGARFRYQGSGNRIKQEALLNGLRAAAGLPPA